MKTIVYYFLPALCFLSLSPTPSEGAEPQSKDYVRIEELASGPNQWAQGTSEQQDNCAAPSPLYSASAVWTGSEMIVWGASAASGLSTGGRYNAALNTWAGISSVGAPAKRYQHSAVWSGSEMIIWGGYDGGSQLNTGGRFNPLLNTWTATLTMGAPTGRYYHTAVWTGTEMIVWGGFGFDGTFLRNVQTGGRYDPAANIWHPTASLAAPAARGDHTAVWTGSEMIIWGGVDYPTHYSSGGRYNPTSDSWTPTSFASAPAAREAHTAVWTGTEMIVWGGLDTSPMNTGGRYNPASDTWVAASTVNAPSIRSYHTAVWAANVGKMIVWGGSDYSGNRWNSGGLYTPASDSWTATSITTTVPGARDSHVAIWTGSEMIVWGGYGFDGPFLKYLQTGGRYNPVTDVWAPTPLTCLPDKRSGTTAIWTGSEMIIWGGVSINADSAGIALGNGGRYDPALNTWTPTSMVNAPSARQQHTAVWTGTEMIVWGGSAGGVAQGTGAKYSPAANRWTALPRGPAARTGHTAVWSGNLMIVWGGIARGRYFSTGSRYDPETDRWSPTSISEATPTERSDHTAVWAGTTMIVWGGVGSAGFENTGARYDPGEDGWRSISTQSAPANRWLHTAVWTGSEMIVWGGQPDCCSTYFGDGGRYNPDNDSWTPTTLTGAPSYRSRHTAVWTGSEMLIWGGGDDLTRWGNGARYNPGGDFWSPIAINAAPEARDSHVAVWTGTEMIVWGGNGVINSYLNSGGRYNVAANSWTARTLDTYTGRSQHTAVWTGSEMIVWGGVNLAGHLNSGGRYNPVLDNWLPTRLAGAPAPRRFHTANWTGTEMVIWGGRNDTALFNTGSRYDPSTDTWIPTSMAGAPSGRQNHTAVWNGKEVIIWGGNDGGYPASVGRYDPAANSWSVLTVVGAPTGRERHSAVWSGTQMIVWGGFDGSAYVSSGGRYNPIANTWTPTSTTSVPPKRGFHTAVWTGDQMIVWGGLDGATSLSSGGVYTPASDSWTPTSATGAPTPRRLHSAVWASSEMIVWGGWNGTTYFGDGARYNAFGNSWTAVPSATGLVGRNSHTAVWTCREMIVFGGFDKTNHLDHCWRYQPYTLWPLPGLYNTGVDNAGNALADDAVDPHYTGLRVNIPCINCAFSPQIATSAGGFPIPPWLPDSPLSAWIAPTASANGLANFTGVPNYGYQLQFNLTGYDPTTALISGRWATDNRGTDIWINGVGTGQPNQNQYTDWSPFQIRSGFVAGLNTILFLVNNEGDASNPTGLRVEMQGTICPLGTPMPAYIKYMAHGANYFDIVWYGQPGFKYRVQYKARLDAPQWTDLSGDVLANGFIVTKRDETVGSNPQRFYKVIIVQ